MEARVDTLARLQLADSVRIASDSRLPELQHFNSAPCKRHDSLQHGCTQCGVKLRRHQRVGVSWLYLRRKGLLADSVGTGKTCTTAGLLALMADRSELHSHGVLVVVRNPTAAYQWIKELNRCLIGINIELATGSMSKAERTSRYLGEWDVLVMNQSILHNDIDNLVTLQGRSETQLRTLIIDDVDALRNFKNKIAVDIKRFAQLCERSYIMTGTPLQKRLEELHSVFEPIGGREVLRSREYFKTVFVREEYVEVRDRNGKKHQTKQVVGYRNLDRFKELITPMTLRRTANDIVDVDLPTIQAHDVWIEMTKAQKDRYSDLQEGILEIIRSGNSQVSEVVAAAKWQYGEQVCVGTATLDGEYREGENSKIDALVEILTEGDLVGEKVVVFSKFKNTIRAAQGLLEARGVGTEVLWGENKGQERQTAIQRFWEDPGCLVLLGTSAMEQSLNLQVSRHLINLNQIMNPARMEQLAGRIRRDGSPHPIVYVHNWLAVDSQEERYMEALEREQALIDHVWDENSELFRSLSPLERLQLITGRH